ncbi:MAG: Arm DNA-binding domain-containing protein [Pseudomonas sp.]|uniref:Arm DNA-binding domain-containing protein n=1 Tax=Pseudomonas sp. TaxID=306 RepID=UPI003BB77221
MDATLDTKTLSALKPKAKPYKATIGLGLHLLINPTGSKLWLFRYRFNGLAKSLSMGAFPATTLAQAIKARDEARNIIKAGTDPSAIRKTERTALRLHAKAFRLVMTLENALTIETPRQILSLTPEQTTAVRAFLLAATSEDTSHAID